MEKLREILEKAKKRPPEVPVKVTYEALKASHLIGIGLHRLRAPIRLHDIYEVSHLAETLEKQFEIIERETGISTWTAKEALREIVDFARGGRWEDALTSYSRLLDGYYLTIAEGIRKLLK